MTRSRTEENPCSDRSYTKIMTDRGRKGPYERNDRRNATIKKYSEELKFSLNISNKDGRNVKTVTNFSDLFP